VAATEGVVIARDPGCPAEAAWRDSLASVSIADLADTIDADTGGTAMPRVRSLLSSPTCRQRRRAMSLRSVRLGHQFGAAAIRIISRAGAARRAPP